MTRKVATVIVALALLIMLGTPATAVASEADQGHTDLSSLPKIEAYLSSIGIDPGSVVVQQGQLNYAGPDCPGEGWNCTTANQVVQLGSATLPSANIVNCSPAVSVTLLGLDECLIIQSSASSLTETANTLNSASCDMEASGGAKQKQKCKVRQQSKKGNNYAEVRAKTTQRGGSAQVATQEAEITQSSEGGNNTAKISQTIEQTLDTYQTAAVTQSQNARQYATVDQTSTTGKNTSYVYQKQFQDESASSSAGITQEQNTDDSLGRNVEAEVTQTSTTGNTTSNLHQVITQDQDASCSPGPVDQAQGNFLGGLEGTVTQMTNSPGVARSTSTQDEDQTQDANTTGTLTQTQEGPEFCCATQIGGTAANVNTVTQSNVQQNDTGDGQNTQQNGKCSTTGGGNCSVDQTYTSNSGTTSNSDTGPVLFCSNNPESGFCSSGD